MLFLQVAETTAVTKIGEERAQVQHDSRLTTKQLKTHIKKSIEDILISEIDIHFVLMVAETTVVDTDEQEPSQIPRRTA